MKRVSHISNRATRNSNHGFTVVELLVVLLVGGILMGLAAIQARTGQLAFRASGAQTRLKGKLHTAREYALSHQRPVLLVFAADGRLLFHEVDSAVSQPEIGELALRFEDEMRFARVEGQGPAPDDLCSTGGTSVLNGREGLQFNSEGRLVDADGEPVSGCFYIAGIPGKSDMSRAVSLFGPTGRLRTYQWQANQWVR